MKIVSLCNTAASIMFLSSQTDSMLAYKVSCVISCALNEMDAPENSFFDDPKRLTAQHGDPAAVSTKLSWILYFSFLLKKI